MITRQAVMIRTAGDPDIAGALADPVLKRELAATRRQLIQAQAVIERQQLHIERLNARILRGYRNRPFSLKAELKLLLSYLVVREK